MRRIDIALLSIPENDLLSAEQAWLSTLGSQGLQNTELGVRPLGEWCANGATGLPRSYPTAE